MKSLRFHAIFVLMILLVVGPRFVSAQTAENLAKTAADGLRNAQSKFFNGQLDQAQTLLKGAQDAIAKLKQTQPDHKQLKTLESKAAKLQTDIDKKLGKKAAPSVPPAASAPPAGASAAKVPSAVKSRIAKMDQGIQQAQQKLDEKNPLNPHLVPASARERLSYADIAWEEIQKGYPDSLSMEEVKQAGERLKAMHEKIDALEKQIQQGKEQAAAQAQTQAGDCKAWEEKLFPFVAQMSEQGYDAKKVLIASYTEEAEEMAHRQMVYAQAVETYKEFQKAPFPNGQTETLKDYASRMDKVLADFDKMIKDSTQWILSELNTELDDTMKRFQENVEKCKDKSAVPYRADNDQIMYMQKKLERAKNLSPQNPQIAETEKKLADLQAENIKWTEFMVDRVRMKPDVFAGDDAKTLKEKAVAIVKEKHEKAEILRTAVVSEGWKEERVLEYTDTTQSAVRYRVSQFLTAQVSAKTADGCRLFTIYLAKDQMTDGKWTPLYGHIMFTDKILEENVNK